MDWTVILSVDISDMDMLYKINKMTKEKEILLEADIHYLPAQVVNRQVQGGVWVSEREVVEKDELGIPEEQIVTQESGPEADTEQARVEADDI